MQGRESDMNPADEMRDWELLVGSKLGLDYCSEGQVFGVVGRLQYARMSSSGVVLHLDTSTGPFDVSSATVQNAYILSPPDGGTENEIAQKATLERQIRSLLGKPVGEGLASRPVGIAVVPPHEDLERFDRLGWIGAVEQREFSIGLGMMLSDNPCPEDNWPK